MGIPAIRKVKTSSNRRRFILRARFSGPGKQKAALPSPGNPAIP
jgi:hypothetical protein